jgi:hypothetical protein
MSKLVNSISQSSSIPLSMKKYIILLFLTLFTVNLFAQTKRVYEHYSFGFGDANRVAVPSFAYTQTMAFGKENSYHLGTGVRWSGFYTRNRAFEGVDSKIKTVTLTPKKRFSANSINIPVIAEFHHKKITVGFNFDLIGFTLGGSRDSLGVSDNYIGRLDSLSSNPTGINFQLFSKKSSGTLNSELYLGYDLADEITLKFGAAMMRSGFRARYVPQGGKETTLGRFTKNQIMPFISIVLNIER